MLSISADFGSHWSVMSSVHISIDVTKTFPYCLTESAFLCFPQYSPLWQLCELYVDTPIRSNIISTVKVKLQCGKKCTIDSGYYNIVYVYISPFSAMLVASTTTITHYICCFDFTSIPKLFFLLRWTRCYISYVIFKWWAQRFSWSCWSWQSLSYTFLVLAQQSVSFPGWDLIPFLEELKKLV